MQDDGRVNRGRPHLSNMEMLISISISIMAIFSAELGCRRPPSNQDIFRELRRN